MITLVHFHLINPIMVRPLSGWLGRGPRLQCQLAAICSCWPRLPATHARSQPVGLLAPVQAGCLSNFASQGRGALSSPLPAPADCAARVQVGKKKTNDVQFYTEVMDTVQTLDAGRRSM